jgi:beta-lactam-binding protein with PASTA domain
MVFQDTDLLACVKCDGMLEALGISIVASKSTALIDRFLPRGSKRRWLGAFVGLPFLGVLVLLFIFDSILMPLVTRQGSEFSLPDFTNQKVIDVDSKLEDENLTYQVSGEEYAPGKEKGIILKQFPIPGTMVKPGRTIKFVLSLGTRIVAIPTVSGKSVRQATLDLEAAGLKLGEISWAVSDTIPEKIVVFSYPAAGAEVPLGSAVNLMVNRGRATDYVFMPKVIGMALSDAKKLIEDKGLKVGIVSTRANENYLPETVLEQSEPEGTELTLGTEIDLVVSES